MHITVEALFIIFTTQSMHTFYFLESSSYVPVQRASMKSSSSDAEMTHKTVIWVHTLSLSHTHTRKLISSWHMCNLGIILWVMLARYTTYQHIGLGHVLIILWNKQSYILYMYRVYHRSHAAIHISDWIVRFKYLKKIH